MASVSSPLDGDSKLDEVKTRNVRAEIKPEAKVDPESLGVAARREIGQAFEWALDQTRVEFKAAAASMGYTHQGVITEWIAGRERLQLDKVKVALPRVYVELLLALLQACEGVEVKTQVTMKRVG